jgi:hypothetical protein
MGCSKPSAAPVFVGSERLKWLSKRAWKGEIAKVMHITLTDPERI